MKNLIFLFSLITLSLAASADVNCKAETGKYSMKLTCDNNCSGVVDKYMPFDDMMSVTYKVQFKSGSETVVVPSSELREMVKSDYEKHGTLPFKEKLVPFVNTTLKKKYSVKDFVSVAPVSAIVAPSIKLYNGLIQDGKVAGTDNVPVSVCQGARRSRISTGVRDGGQGGAGYNPAVQ